MSSADCFNLDQSKFSSGNGLRYLDPEVRIFNHVVSDISVVLRETALATSDSTELGSPFETKMLRVFSVSTMEITKTIRDRNVESVFRKYNGNNEDHSRPKY